MIATRGKVAVLPLSLSALALLHLDCWEQPCSNVDIDMLFWSKVYMNILYNSFIWTSIFTLISHLVDLSSSMMFDVYTYNIHITIYLCDIDTCCIPSRRYPSGLGAIIQQSFAHQSMTYPFQRSRRDKKNVKHHETWRLFKQTILSLL